MGCFLRQEGDKRRAQHNDPDDDPKAEDHRVLHPAGGETGEAHPSCCGALRAASVAIISSTLMTTSSGSSCQNSDAVLRF